MLSRRLRRCLDNVVGDVLYDIGTDHAYLPIAAVKEGRVKKAYAVDNKQGPLEAASRHIREAGVASSVETRLASGLDGLPDDVDTVVIAGIGGGRIKSMLEAADGMNVRRFVLQPSTHPERVRGIVNVTSLKIVDEDAVADKSGTHIIIVIEEGAQRLDEKERLFGPVLLKERPDAYYKKLIGELDFLNALLERIPEGKAKAIRKKREYLKEVLHEWN